jgi:hypothetical protein
MADFIATKNAAAKEGGALGVFIWIGYTTQKVGEYGSVAVATKAPKIQAPSFPMEPFKIEQKPIPSNARKVFDLIKSIEDKGGLIRRAPEGNQEFNITLKLGNEKLDLRVETHTLPKNLGGKGPGIPIRHMNVDLTPGGKNLPNSGHIILD